MSHLRLKPKAETGHIQHICKNDARNKHNCPNWSYVGFDVFRLEPGKTLNTADTQDTEMLLVIITGKMKVTAGGQDLGEVGGRMDVFSKEKAHAVYVPSGSSWAIEATTDLELALCSAPGKGNYPVRVISPDPSPMEERGKGANTRFVNAFMMEDQDFADSLLVTEVWTPNGNWSSYPSHKHDQDNFPDETYLEETYYHRINPGTGFGVQRVYNDDLSLDETIAVYDCDLVLVPEGYHPCSALYGHDMYYLNVMAGPMRKWRFTNAPEHERLFRRDGGKKPGE